MVSQEKFSFNDDALRDSTFPLDRYVLTVVRDAEYSQMLFKKSFSQARQQIETAHMDVDALKCSPQIARQALGSKADAFLKDRAEFLTLRKEIYKYVSVKEIKKLPQTDRVHIYLLAHIVYPQIFLENVLDDVDIATPVEQWYKSGKGMGTLRETLHPIINRLVGKQGKYFWGINIRKSDLSDIDLFNFIASLRGKISSKKAQEKSFTTLLSVLAQNPEKHVVKGVASTDNINRSKPIPVKAKKKSVHIEMKDLLVRSNAFQCRNRLHSMQEVDALVDVLDNSNHIKNIKVAAGYCEQCNVYFIMDSVYQRLKSYGIILCRISDGKDYFNKSSSAGMHMAQESLLMQYGYNVSQVRGLSTEQRQKILALIIDNKIMSRNEIIGYLNFFIRQRKAMPKMRSAVEKWEQDKKYVEKYRVGQYRTVTVNGIKNNKKTVRNR